jgi:T4 RnlA family RNA ligase
MPKTINDIDNNLFKIKECVFGQDDCLWVSPKLMGVAWDKGNLGFRSSIWRKKDMLPVSLGFRKFFNWEEKPDIYPPPTSLSAKVRCMEKVDGSCLIVSKYKGELIIRTRNALASNHLNGEEIELLKRKYPKAFDNDYLNNEQHSLIFEWTTPSNQIVIAYPEIDIVLLNIVDHRDYSYLTQLNILSASIIMGVRTPIAFTFDSIEDMLKEVEGWEDEEGLCVYYGEQQHIRKIKSNWYLNLHKFKSDCTIDNLMALFIDQGCPDYNSFTQYVTNTFDFECAKMSAAHIAKLCDAYKQVKQIITGMQDFVTNACANLATRKEQAEKILAAYGDTNRASMLFYLLDGHEDLNKEQYKKLIYQCL